MARPASAALPESVTAAAKRQKGADETPTVCVMGATGVGKGSTLNSCFRSDRYSVSHMFASDTNKPSALVLPWRVSGRLMRGVDLCGFSDSEGRDSGFIEAMVNYLKNEVAYVHCFLLLFNSQEARIGIHLKDMLMALKSVFGLEFMKNAMIGFTRWEYTKKAEVLRRGITKEMLTKNVNKLLRDILGHSHDCDCLFIDNTVNACSDQELQMLYGEELPSVTGAFEEVFASIERFALGRSPFKCTDIASTLAERDVGRDTMEREKLAYAEGIEATASLKAAWDALAIKEPEALEEQLRAEASARRELLSDFLAAKTHPDLEHVKASVLEAFDADVCTHIKSACFRNRDAASSCNRSLRLELVADYKEVIDKLIGRASLDKQEQFEEVCREDREAILRFVKQSKGGSLSLGAFYQLQERLRWEQLEARSKIFGDLQGDQLPDVRNCLQDAKSLAAFLGREAAPDWLAKLLQG